MPIANELPVTWEFLQDPAPNHGARIVKNWLRDEGVRLMQWTAYSSDLKPMDNIWRIIVQKVCANSRQFYKKEDLRQAIRDGWDSIDTQRLQNLYLSTEKRCMQLLNTQGSKLSNWMPARPFLSSCRASVRKQSYTLEKTFWGYGHISGMCRLVSSRLFANTFLRLQMTNEVPLNFKRQ